MFHPSYSVCLSGSLYPLTRILPAFTYFKEAGLSAGVSGATTPRPEMQQRDCPRHRHLVQEPAQRVEEITPSSGGNPAKLQVSLWHYKPASGEDDVTMVTPEHDVVGHGQPLVLDRSLFSSLRSLGTCPTPLWVKYVPSARALGHCGSFSTGSVSLSVPLRASLLSSGEIHKSAYWKKKWSTTPRSMSPAGPSSRASSGPSSRRSSDEFTLPPGPLSETPGTKSSGIGMRSLAMSHWEVSLSQLLTTGSLEVSWPTPRAR